MMRLILAIVIIIIFSAKQGMMYYAQKTDTLTVTFYVLSQISEFIFLMIIIVTHNLVNNIRHGKTDSGIVRFIYSLLIIHYVLFIPAVILFYEHNNAMMIPIIIGDLIFIVFSIVTQYIYNNDNNNEINENTSIVQYENIENTSIIQSENIYMNSSIKWKSIKKENILNNQCSICLEEYNDTDVVNKLNCNHIFHEKCINIWAVGNDTCPLCRGIIF